MHTSVLLLEGLRVGLQPVLTGAEAHIAAPKSRCVVPIRAHPTRPVFPNAQRGGLTQASVRLARDRTVVDTLPLRLVQFLSTYPRCSIGISTPEGVVHIGPRIPPTSSEQVVSGKGTLVRCRP